MSPPEVWGPPIWTLFHTLIEKLNPNLYQLVIPSMFSIIKGICRYLPCPDCSDHASKFLNKLNLNNYKTKNDFKNMLYLFHNLVNARKRKGLFNYTNIDKYSKLNINKVIHDFFKHYNTKGNLRLLTESFQRNIIKQQFIKWYYHYAKAFVNIPLKPNEIKHEISEEVNNEVKDEPKKEVNNEVKDEPKIIVHP